MKAHRRWPLLLLLCSAVAVAGSLHVHVSGRVAHPGVQTVAAGTRLDAVTLAADMQRDAYVLGAAWLRPSLQPRQRRLKAGLLFDLQVLRGDAHLRGDVPLATLATQWLRWLHQLPVSGRKTDIDLDPRTLEIARINPHVADGDRVIYPGRPSTVRVVGAVARFCTLPFVPMQAALDYLKQCASTAAASPDWLYVIQADGTVERRGIGPWNRDKAVALAPGALLYVPIRKHMLAVLKDPTFNARMARFLATQPLPEQSR